MEWTSWKGLSFPCHSYIATKGKVIKFAMVLRSFNSLNKFDLMDKIVLLILSYSNAQYLLVSLAALEIEILVLIYLPPLSPPSSHFLNFTHSLLKTYFRKNTMKREIDIVRGYNLTHMQC